MGVEARRLHHLRLAKGRREVVGPEDEGLHPVVPARHRAQHRLHLVGFADVATGQQRQGAEAQRAAQHVAAIDPLDEAPVLSAARSGRCRACGRKIERDGVRIVMSCSSAGLIGSSCGGGFARDLRTAGHHGHQRMRHQQRQRDVHHDERHDRGHAEEMDEPRVLEAAEQRQQLGELDRLPDRQPGNDDHDAGREHARHRAASARCCTWSDRHGRGAAAVRP